MDHRQLADEMEIFFLDESIGAGLPIWLPNGVAIREALENFVCELERRAGYQRVVSPHIGKEELYRASGHLSCFQENMFPPMSWPEEASKYYLRPMNCPHHHKAFASALRSYRDLPLRFAEYGQVYRYENSGSLRGLSRVRGLCQNDAHIYLDPMDALAEVKRVLEMHERCYAALGLKGYRYRLSLHDSARAGDFVGSQQDWLRCEEVLRQALLQKGLQFFEAVGEAAFYGPKIDVQMAVGGQHEESIASVQLDFNSADRFDLQFVNSSGARVRPWIVHRAPLGSHERFIAMLLEFFSGQLPGWLAPVQLCILPVAEGHLEAARLLRERLHLQGLRVHLDHGSGSLRKRVLISHRLRPFAKLIIGDKEVDSGQFRLQLRDNEVLVANSDLERVLLQLVKPPL